MKVILLQDVAKIGRRGDVVEVQDGYAMNKLVPKRMAEPATAMNKKRIEKMQADAVSNKAAEESRFETAQKALLETTVQITADVNEKGHTFKAVNEQDIADAAVAAGVDIDAAMIAVGTPIKEVGEHVVELVSGESKGKFKIEVIKK